jgi:hypothetical protein
VPLATAVGRLCDGTAAARDGSKGTPEPLRQFLGSWSEHVGSWVDDSGLPLHVVRYEDLAADPLDCFGGVVKFCGLDYDGDLVSKAVEFSSFDELRRQEAAAGFRERSARAPGGFFRRGEVGSWRDELPPDLAQRLVAVHGPMMERFGYAY